MNQTGRILEEVKKAVCGKDRVLVWVLTVLLARGHVLLEDIPGVGKTTMALAFSRALGLEYGRVQFTPDVLPSDITGYSVYQKETGKLVYQPGAVLCNLFLADELNRATSRTQSALLEAMEEGQVTVDGVSHPIPQPFIVFATQNPTGAAGTHAGSGGRSASDHAGAAARRDPASGPVAKTVRLWRKTAFSTGCFYSQP